MPQTSTAKLLICLGLTPLFLSSACIVTRSEGDQIQDTLVRLKKQNTATAAEVTKLNMRLAQLEDSITAAKQNDAQNSLGEEHFNEELQLLKGQIEEIKHEMAGGTKNGVSSENLPERSEPSLDKAALFEAAKELSSEKKLNEANEKYAEFIERFSDDKELLDKALFNSAENYVKLASQNKNAAQKKEQYKKSILLFQQLLTKFPKSSLTSVTLFKTGETLENMGYHSDALVFFQELVEKHKKSEFATQARKHIRTINARDVKKK